MLLSENATQFRLTGTPFLEYLPVVDLSTGRLLGMEALVRWHHPVEGLISPKDLIPRVEESGDIEPLTRWILMESCAQARHWLPSMQLGVNCTVNQLRRGEISRAVGEALDQTGLRPDQLTVEVTEDAVIDDAAEVELQALAALRVQLSVDDVGTNWSSFEPFRRNSVSTVKIDGSFVSGLEPVQGINRLVVETVIHMARSMGMAALVEGVETIEQLNLVRSFGADAAQGFFFSAPMSAEAAQVFAGGDRAPFFSLATRRTVVTEVPELTQLLQAAP